MSEKSWRKWCEELGLYVTIRQSVPWEYTVYTEDGVLYSAQEIFAMKMRGVKISKQVHIIKKAFDGTLTDILPKDRRLK